MARPKKYDEAKMAKIIDEYANAEDIPILKEVCYQNKWNWKYLYELAEKHEGLSDSIKMLIQKKEAQLEKLALFNVINSTMAIFSLKQLGWSDKLKTDEGEELTEAFKEIAASLIGGDQKQ